MCHLLIISGSLVGSGLRSAALSRDRLPSLGRLVVVAPVPDEEQAFLLMKWGICDYIPFGLSPEQCGERLRQVFEGRWLLDSEIFSRWRPRSWPQDVHGGGYTTQDENVVFRKEVSDTSRPIPPSPLTEREREIVTWIARGLSNKGIAQELKIGEQAVKNHITSILKKLSVSDRTAAAVSALLHEWITINLTELSSCSSASPHAPRA
jgi:DNA-binding NarL/FixJ family response regulator